ncbi:hypothetical protein Hanom_Chr13g01202221 [Helianthus anomalus]
MATSDYVLMIDLMIAISLAFSIIADPELLQDVCVADLASGTSCFCISTTPNQYLLNTYFLILPVIREISVAKL